MNISLEQVQTALQTEDIEGLHVLGAPEDEYIQEARGIVSVLTSLNNPSEIEVTTAIRQVWEKSFGPFSETEINQRSSAFQRIAHIFMLTSQAV